MKIKYRRQIAFAQDLMHTIILVGRSSGRLRIVVGKQLNGKAENYSGSRGRKKANDWWKNEKRVQSERRKMATD